MVSINESINSQKTQRSFYDFVFTDLADKRTNHWFLISDPGPGLAILGLWLYFVLKIGPKWMENKKPFQLRTVLIVYNIFQVIINIYLFYEGGRLGWFGKYNYNCEPVNFSLSQTALDSASMCHAYFLLKMTELADTVFFVLRKNNRQVTFLHLYHHTVMPMAAWGATKYFPGGHGTFIGFINAFVHIIMYGYYSLAALGPGVQKYLWWKKYITTLQMVQFCMVFIHNSQLFWFDCGYPRWTAFLTLPNAIFFYQLFNQFYKSSYTKPASVNKDAAVIKNGKIK
ncbi:unnamed protein product [Phyllotreta striolata]|uniref:Elongation of very long chain fatty acids protein n=1 Tax=Phyllotreta striolata TaxID=444603 RepID=A0A9N9XRM9_PHYSR|nr:unnamed protein product [Phyllotreta striolata]